VTDVPTTWDAPPAVTRLDDGTVDVWHLPLDRAVPSADVLSADERARAARLRFPRDAARWTAARAWTRTILAGYVDREAAGLVLTAAPREKPTLTGPVGAPAFNVSHSGDVALLAVGRGLDVGVDVEQVTAMDDAEILLVARRVLPARDVDDLLRTAPDLRCARFHRVWVRHEARVKCRGTGLGEPEEAFDDSDDGAVVVDLDVGADHRGALAVSRAPVRLRLWSPSA
jgi:4'-phosphopantetheinyl transferase